MGTSTVTYSVSLLGFLLACFSAYMLWKTSKENKQLEEEAGEH